MRQQLFIVLIAFSAALAGFALSVWLTRQPDALVLEPASTVPAVPKTTHEAVIGMPAPRFTLNDLDGRTHSLDDWRGKVVLINFWATWCPPCVHEIPELIRLQQELGVQGLQVVGISDEEPEPIRAFMQRVSFNYPVLRNPLELGDLSINYGNRNGILPYSVLLDRQGVIRKVYHGALHFDPLRRDLAELLQHP